MKKSLILKLIVLAILCYVAILPAASESCPRSECVSVQTGGTWENACAYYEGYNNHPAQCVMRSVQTGPNTWDNFCAVESC